MEEIGAIIPILIWAVVGLVIANVKKKAMSKQATSSKVNQPQPIHRPSSGGWAEMLGIPSNPGSTTSQTLRKLISEVEATFSDPSPAKPVPEVRQVPKPEPVRPRLTSAFASPSDSTEGMASSEGTDDCHNYMLPEAAQEPSSPSAPGTAEPAVGFALQWDAAAMAQGFVMAEILTRPAQRRRPGTWQNR